ncbi:type IX secretion system outer membrane channel protein PorV [Mucilaginibacter myungsuensis]|uniref:Type IX secretion system outer membrane channel protein PorV n=1 Tax=Mucilaginibacter myungsuensis TaxID=649104 RepID=A0A929PWM6_9SPHI|nr:type IX secretion system outer membrane channel protein PorV [Mucilaginibacter myungsuensis]MBE9662299.1 type IX secretion system outer membrane channel protein PorV [Mucilaginibacter myungsuensis]MDN3599264.1 type IX secretion system outer membrane channel protein PorV [Mucilaginibacter myungsuensis]
MTRLFPKAIIKISSLMVALLPLAASAQVIGPGGTTTTGSAAQDNPIITGVPFLSIAPDSRSGAMGDAGVALSTDVNANYWNPSKLAFIGEGTHFALSYSPWLRRLVPDVDLAYLSFAKKVDDRNTIGASLRYFNLGSIQLVDANQNDQGTYRPTELSLDVTLARQFGENFSLGLTGRFIHSNLSNGAFTAGQQTRAANAVAADASMYYRNPTQQFGKDAIFAFGVNISNIGTKISYSDNGVKYFLPTNLRIGAANTWMIDEYNEFTLAFDINKLLVPTPPLRDNTGAIISGKSDDRSVVSGIFGSFSDAPGGFGEEMREITYSPGLEYWYNKQFALRAGYFYENPNKGARQYLTLGAGFKYDIFNIDFSYLAASQQRSPLSNTLRFSLLVNFGATGKQQF